MARDKQFITRCNDEEYAKLEALAEKKFECSMAEANRTIIGEMFYHAFGDLDPDALVDGRIDDGDIEALNEGDLSSEDFPEDVRDVDADKPELTVSSDGGVKPAPGSYQATYSPQDVAKPGPELPWGKLVDTIDLYWSDTLEVHPDRVPESPSKMQLKAGDPNRLKQVNRVTPKVIAGMCRSVADYDVLPGELLTEFIDDYLAHLNTRENEEQGRKHLHENYRERVGELLYEHPDPGKDMFYTTEEKLSEVVEETVKNPFSGSCETHPAVFNHQKWCVATKDTADGQSLADWHEDLGRWVERVATLHQIRTEPEYIDLAAESDVDLSESEYDGVNHYLTMMVVTLCDQYRKQTNTEQREIVESEYVSEEAISVLQDLL